MFQMGVIFRVNESTPLVFTSGGPKPNGDVRICVDLTKLNQKHLQGSAIHPFCGFYFRQVGRRQTFFKN